MNQPFRQALPELLDYLFALQQESVLPREARGRLQKLRAVHPDLQIDLLAEEVAFDRSVHYDALLRRAGEGTVSMSYCPERAIPWPLRGVHRWSEGDLVRVNYSLTDAKSGKVIKAGSADSPVTDPFAIEDEVTKGVAAALGFSLKADESRELAFHGTSVPDAYNFYTQARGYLEDAAKAANIDSAIILLGEALKADPNYGKAEAELGSAYFAKYGTAKDKSLIAKSRQACSKAIDLGNAGAAGHVLQARGGHRAQGERHAEPGGRACQRHVPIPVQQAI